MSSPDLLVDTSVAIALVLADHEAHRQTIDYLDGALLGLAGHAWFEAYSVLTRLPPPARRRPAEVASILGHNFPESRFLSEEATAELSEQLVGIGVSGGSVYDALVGQTAAAHGLPLVSRDARASEVYRALGVSVRLVG